MIVVTTWPTAGPLTEQVLREISGEMGKEYGKDYVNLGFKEGREIVMTGMGSDGREGAAWVKAKGGRILTEAEDTCVVYGMPRSVARCPSATASRASTARC